MMSENDSIDTNISPCLGSYYDTMFEEEHRSFGESESDIAPPPPYSVSEQAMGGNAVLRQDGVATGDRMSRKNLIPSFSTETLQEKLSKIYGHDFGSLPFDLADTENEVSYLVLPEKRKLIEKNYQLLLVIHLFENSLAEIYGPVGHRVMTAERRRRLLQEGLTAALIEETHADAVQLYKTEKTAKLEKIETIGEVLRSETNHARILSVDKPSGHQGVPSQRNDDSPMFENRTKLVSVDLTDDETFEHMLQVDQDSSNSENLELVSSSEELEFVSDYKTSVLDAKKAFAKNWVVMQAAEYELKLISDDCHVARQDVDAIEERDTFVRLTLFGPQPSVTESSPCDETEAQLLQLGEELKKVSDIEVFYRELRKRPKREFKDAALIVDIIATIDILLKELVKQRKEVEKQIRHCKGVRLKTKIMSRPLPRLLSYGIGAVRRKSTSDASSSASTSTARFDPHS